MEKSWLFGYDELGEVRTEFNIIYYCPGPGIWLFDSYDLKRYSRGIITREPDCPNIF